MRKNMNFKAGRLIHSRVYHNSVEFFQYEDPINEIIVDNERIADN